MNKLLQRQIAKYLSNTDSISENIQKLLAVISESYDHYEKDRTMLEHSIEISSKEMIELNSKLRADAEKSSKVLYKSLKESLALLNDTKEDTNIQDLDFHKLSQIANLLKDETKKRKTAEKERKQRAAHLEASQRIAHIGSWEIDLSDLNNLNSNPLYWSDETYCIFGFEPGAVEVTNDLFFSKVHPDDLEIIQKAVKNALEKGEAYDLDHRIILSDGTEKIVHERSDIIKNEKTGLPVKMIGTVQDITNKKKADRELRKVNYELKTLFENMQECVFTVDMINYKLIQISSSCEDIYGYTVEEFMNNNNLWIEVVVEEDKAAIWAKNSILEKGESIVNTYRIYDKMGNIRWLESKLKPSLNKENKLVRLDGVTSDITKKVEAEQALKDSEFRFRSLLENASDAIMLVNKKLEPFYVSDSIYKITGYTIQEIMGTPTINHIYIGDRPVVNELIKNVFANPNKAYTITYRRVKKDGTIIWCEGSATNLLHVPSVQGIVVNFRDITERMESEKILQENEYRFRSLIENSSDATVVINKDFKIIFASDSISRVTGYNPSELLGNSNSDTVYYEDRNIAETFLTDILSNPGKAKSIIYRIVKKSGEVIWAERVATNLIDDPVIKGIVINFRDITENKNAEIALRESEYKFRSLIKNSSDVITVMDKESNFMFVSDSIYKVTGYKPEELIGLSSIIFVHPDDHALLKDTKEKVLNNPGKITTTKYRRLKKDGTYIWVEGTVNNLLNEPAVNGIVVNFRDITERTKHEEAIKISNEELKKSNSELDRFVYSVSHDLKAPLSSMLGVVSLIETETTDNSIADDVQLLKKSINKLDGFINDILDYSRNARLEIRSKEIHFPELLNDIKHNLKYMSSLNSNLEIITNINNGIPYYSDEGRINIILNNLISNAIRYSNPNVSKPIVEVNIQINKDYALLIVKDNGIGISKENKEKVFDMFYRVSKKSVGSGLGLYIVKETVEKLNGTIQLDSEIEKGSQFTIALPNLLII